LGTSGCTPWNLASYGQARRRGLWGFALASPLSPDSAAPVCSLVRSMFYGATKFRTNRIHPSCQGATPSLPESILVGNDCSVLSTFWGATIPPLKGVGLRRDGFCHRTDAPRILRASGRSTLGTGVPRSLGAAGPRVRGASVCGSGGAEEPTRWGRSAPGSVGVMVSGGGCSRVPGVEPARAPWTSRASGHRFVGALVPRR
jgi:hypothetical protein